MLRDARQRVERTFPMLRPEAVVLASFACTILVGTLLLSLPISHRHGVDFADALFTATSAVCVTGLVVVDTGRDFTLVGQVVILILIELGGLGVMTFAAIAFEMLGKRLSLSGQEAMTSALVHESMALGFRFHFRRMLQLILIIEAIGASLLFVGMLPNFGIVRAGYSAIFHSVSAFCNAGFSLYEDSLIGLRANWLVTSTVGLLIIIGGIGHPVLFDIWANAKSSQRGKIPVWARLTVHTRITLITTVCLLFLGFILLLLIGNSHGELDAATALFQSVTARTAGFNTVVIGQLPLTALLVLTGLMFIGGSPGSCAGGIKTTTFALWFTQLFGRLRGKKAVILQQRYIPQALVRRSSTIISLALLWNALGVFILSITETGISDLGLHHIMFEQMSAFGTVGLSTGITPDLSPTGRLWIIVTMFVGRTGPLTSVLLLLRRRPCEIKYPEGKVMIG